MMMSNRPHIQAVAPSMTTVDEAHDLAERLTDALDMLAPLIEQETALVRSGKVREAMANEERKADLSRSYASAIAHLKANQPFMKAHAPELLAQLQQRHATFREMLQINLTVLATAHAVSEGIIRGVNGEMQRTSMPSTYTASGNRTAPGPRNVMPLSVSRTL